eukprot:TRINITY_DN54175_c0_g1_i1.p1 TRINITY_DN54175_c0_g1~~TRINITY_DN54175_c0_g1_i1.p1  ORF type:complete len:284 (+),score=51.76 TRINITY_DN54175_c0_g1_i1:71-922(+)
MLRVHLLRRWGARACLERALLPRRCFSNGRPGTGVTDGERDRRIRLATALVTGVTGVAGLAWWQRRQADLDDDADDVDYSDTEYWERRYEAYPEVFDWFGQLPSLEPWIAPVASGKQRIVHLGCGTSVLPEEMHDKGCYGDIYNVDSSKACIDTMKLRNQTKRPQLKWLQADVRDLTGVFVDGEFDVAIEKSTLDAVCDNGHSEAGNRYVSEVARILHRKGEFLAFSFGPPASRLPYLEKHFDCKVHILHDHRCFAYQCVKKSGSGAGGGVPLADLREMRICS